MADQSVILTREKVEARDVSLDHLTNCRVEIQGTPSTLNISSMTNCTIFSVFSVRVQQLEEDREEDLDCENTTHGMKEDYTPSTLIVFQVYIYCINSSMKANISILAL